MMIFVYIITLYINTVQLLAASFHVAYKAMGENVFFTPRVKLHFCQIQSRFELTNVDIAMNTLSENKQIVARFNREVIEQGNMQTFNELVAADFINHTAPPGTPNGRDGFAAFFTNVLRPPCPI